MACDGNPASSASPSQVQAFASRNLDLLQLIEKTVSRLTADAEMLDVQTRDIGKVLTALGKLTDAPDVDPEGRVSELLRMSADVTQRLHAKISKQRLSAASDGALVDEDGVVDAFDKMLESLASYFEALDTLRETVQTLASTHSPVIGVFTSTEDLFDALDS